MLRLIKGHGADAIYLTIAAFCLAICIAWLSEVPFMWTLHWLSIFVEIWGFALALLCIPYFLGVVTKRVWDGD